MEGTNIVVNMGKGNSVGNANAALVFLLEDDIWGFLVDADAEAFKFGFDDSFVSQGFIDI